MTTYRRADNHPSRRPTALRQRFFHDDHPAYAADSFRGIKHAHAAGWPNTDNNHLTDVTGQSWCQHWGMPLLHGWRDPQRAMSRFKRFKRMTPEQIERLRPRDGSHYRIRRSKAILRETGQVGIGEEFEAKNGRWSYAVACALKDEADLYDRKVIVKTLSTLGGKKAALRRLKVFHRAGFTTVILPRGLHRVPRSWWPWIDHVRGRVRWTGKPTKEF